MMGLLLFFFPNLDKKVQRDEATVPQHGSPIAHPRTTQTASGRTTAGVGTIRNETWADTF